MVEILVRIPKKVVVELKPAVEPGMIKNQMNADEFFAIPINNCVFRDIGGCPAGLIFKHRRELILHSAEIHIHGGLRRQIKV
ncbi:MAG: hypothetical protein M3O74_26440 [Pseudomonadota bacterium]|nr:hypothetical protein [Pseudomonadota bacterium]